MHLDVLALRNFYYRSALGRAAQKMIRTEVTKAWPEAQGQTVAGFGFAVPLLRPYLKSSRRVIALMPAPQGVMPWPAGAPNVAVLCEEMLWPVETGHVDKLIVMHGLETSESPSKLLEECYRVLGPGGRALFIVPNRAGLWSRSDETPFGFGRPYSQGQLETQLRSHGFMPERHSAALFQPPSARRFWMKTGPVWEKLGHRTGLGIAGGVLMVEVTKRTSAPVDGGDPVRALNPLTALGPKPAAPTKALRQGGR